MASNAAIDRLRRERRHLLESVDDRFDLADRGTTPETSSEAERLLRRFPPLVRTLFWLQQMEGWTHEELANRFGMTPSWSKSILSRALGTLRQELNETTPND